MANRQDASANLVTAALPVSSRNDHLATISSHLLCQAGDSKQLSGPNIMLTIQFNKMRQLLLAGHDLRCCNHLKILNSKLFQGTNSINMQSQKPTDGRLSAAAAGSQSHA